MGLSPLFITNKCVFSAFSLQLISSSFKIYSPGNMFSNLLYSIIHLQNFIELGCAPLLTSYHQEMLLLPEYHLSFLVPHPLHLPDLIRLFHTPLIVLPSSRL